MSATAFQRNRREEAARLKKAASNQESNVNELTVKQIKTILDEKGIKYDAKAKKDELIKLLEGAE